uniref:Cytochrome c oxidase subunit 3 n=1 Tax=Obrimoposthia wandeli TaxID=2136291 RepID=A0A7D5Y3M2_9PLAT|nr:cytochrome c oxidase subunit III [Obrimoposthia wandeli]QLJ92316.1 cytochrome oxidase subunit 3 [Obrimoposthia wandeli]
MFLKSFNYLSVNKSYFCSLYEVFMSFLPAVLSVSVLSLLVFLVAFWNQLLGFFYVKFSFFFIVVLVLVWFFDLLGESQVGSFSNKISQGLRMSVVLFIFSEVFLFFSFFWAFFHFSNSSGYVSLGFPANVVDAGGIPFLGSFILLYSALSFSLAQWGLFSQNYSFFVIGLVLTIIFGFLFILVQVVEYSSSFMSVNFSTPGAVFYVTTCLHGSHVFLGTLGIIYFLVRGFFNFFFSSQSHVGFEAALWYWHFVDVVWLFLFIFVYLLCPI